jgi:hypothetical protein
VAVLVVSMELQILAEVAVVLFQRVAAAPVVQVL